MTTTTPAPRAEVTLGDRRVTIERPSALKASRALALMRALSRAMPGLQDRLGEFRREYERNNVIELDRVQAKIAYPPRPIILQVPNDDGTFREEAALDEHGEPLMQPSPVDRLTEADWTAAGGVYRRPASPSSEEVIVALFDVALETAEEHVYKLLALFTIPNDDLKRARKDQRIDELLDETVDELLDDSYADEVLELAVVAGETVDHHFRRKTGELGDRLGNVLRLVGMGPRKAPTTSPSTSNDGPSSSRPSSSTDSPESTEDGAPTPSSTPPSSSSSSSADSSTATPSNGGSPTPSAAPA